MRENLCMVVENIGAARAMPSSSDINFRWHLGFRRKAKSSL